MVEQCCCGCTLQQGVKGIGIFSICHGIAAFLFCWMEADEYDSGSTLLTIGIVMGSIFGLIGVLLMVGAFTESWGFLLPWLIIEIIVMILQGLSSIMSGILGIIIGILWIALEMYFYAVVLSYYKQLRAQVAELPNQGHPQISSSIAVVTFEGDANCKAMPNDYTVMPMSNQYSAMPMQNQYPAMPMQNQYPAMPMPINNSYGPVNQV